MNAEPHVQAVLDLLEAATAATAVAVHDGKAPNQAPTPYLVVNPEIGVAGATPDGGGDLTLTSRELSMAVHVMSVGGSRWQATTAAEIARGALLDVVPTVDSRQCWPIRQELAQPARLDVDDPDLFVAVAIYRVRSIPA